MDAVIAQGWEAGGHRGAWDPDAPDDRLGTLALTRLLVRALDVPVIAAGGIMDGAGIAAALALGAAAAQLGTAFVGADESDADPGFKDALRTAGSTAMTRAVSGRAARGFAHPLSGLPEDQAPDYPVAYDLAQHLRAAGGSAYGARWAGQGAPLARFAPTSEIFAALVSELIAARPWAIEVTGR